MIEGIEVAVDRQAMVLAASAPLTVLSSAFLDPRPRVGLPSSAGTARIDPSALVDADVRAALRAAAGVGCDEGGVDEPS